MLSNFPPMLDSFVALDWLQEHGTPERQRFAGSLARALADEPDAHGEFRRVTHFGQLLDALPSTVRAARGVRPYWSTYCSAYCSALAYSRHDSAGRGTDLVLACTLTPRERASVGRRNLPEDVPPRSRIGEVWPVRWAPQPLLPMEVFPGRVRCGGARAMGAPVLTLACTNYHATVRLHYAGYLFRRFPLATWHQMHFTGAPDSVCLIDNDTPRAMLVCLSDL